MKLECLFDSQQATQQQLVLISLSAVLSQQKRTAFQFVPDCRSYSYVQTTRCLPSGCPTATTISHASPSSTAPSARLHGLLKHRQQQLQANQAILILRLLDATCVSCVYANEAGCRQFSAQAFFRALPLRLPRAQGILPLPAAPQAQAQTTITIRPQTSARSRSSSGSRFSQSSLLSCLHRSRINAGWQQGSAR